jgi:hypothetical protein
MMKFTMTWDYSSAMAENSAADAEQDKFKALLEGVKIAAEGMDTSKYKIVASAFVVSALQSLDEFTMNKKVRNLSDGKQSVGWIGKFKVIRDLTATTDYLHVYRGKKKEEIIIQNLSNSSVGGMLK